MGELLLNKISLENQKKHTIQIIGKPYSLYPNAQIKITTKTMIIPHDNRLISFFFSLQNSLKDNF